MVIVSAVFTKIENHLILLGNMQVNEVQDFWQILFFKTYRGISQKTGSISKIFLIPVFHNKKYYLFIH